MAYGLERRLIRLEGEINTIARAMIWVLTIAVGFAVYVLSIGNALAPYFGLGAVLIAAGAFEWRMRKLEKWFPYEDNSA